MGLLAKLFKNKKQEILKDEGQDRLVNYKIIEGNIESTLNKEIQNFFPKTGHWMSNCFQRSSDVYRRNLPCHLRDNNWMSKLMHKELKEKEIFISQQAIKTFMDNSKEFAELRHNYELEIVRWQINWIKGGGEGWCLPDGYNDSDIIFSPSLNILSTSGLKIMSLSL